ncbi:MAG: hypothetical protein QXV17_11300 [Candidatus Micrarchaeaceae archaeon]
MSGSSLGDWVDNLEDLYSSPPPSLLENLVVESVDITVPTLYHTLGVPYFSASSNGLGGSSTYMKSLL